jgi:ferric-dicitrate binding protein FerR (iron transport regulator)
VDTLADGSVVTLNKNARIHYPSRFTGNSRPVTLEGEAFFNVTANKEKPFIIRVKDISITVVGTSFNVSSKNGMTEIIVETGIVQVRKDNRVVELRRGESTRVKDGDLTMTKDRVADKLYNYYRSKEFVCDDTPLWKLVEVLNAAYDANIIISNDELRNLKLNTTFNNESLDKILEVISLTFGINISKEGNQIILKANY